MTADDDVIAIDISDTPEFVGLLGYDPLLFEGTDSLTLLCRPRKKPDEPAPATAEQVFFGAIARARDAALEPSRARKAKPKKQSRRR